MDKFLVRTPRIVPDRKKPQQQDKELKQTTILSLKRVVVVEEIQQCKAMLEIENQDPQIIIDQLNTLEKKIPSREVLDETKVGLTLNKLRKHENKEVADRSTAIYRCWKKHFKDMLDKPKIEVRFDNASNKYRSSSRKLIHDLLQPHRESTILAEAIERCVFGMNSNTSNSYRRQVRGIVFTLRYQDGIKEKVLNKQLTVTELCEMKKKAK